MTSILRTTWFWASFWVITAILFTALFMGYALYLLLAPRKKQLFAHKMACLWGVLVFKANPGWTYELRGSKNLPKEGAVIVANHSSGMDICAILATNIQFRFLSKASVFKVPLIGNAMKLAGYVPITRGAKGSHKEALNKSSEWIHKGVPMVFYPEGTRSLDGKIAPFKSGAFRLAIAENVPIIPLVIKGTNEMMKKNSFAPRPAHVIIDALEPVYPAAADEQTSLSNRIREKMIQRHNNL